ncbi:STAS domain-containing protein [Planctomicrobium sp. SH664]|uniref:STAS domain-containing protein n=1 Tax=Planctomicrobium sp. SH664 TaxID=3448125 RepID=UPI003F5C490C
MTEPSEFESQFFGYNQEGDLATVLMTRAQLTETQNLVELEKDWNTLIETCGVRRMILDLSSVSYLTSIAVATLIDLHRKLQDVNGRLVLCGLQPTVAKILQTSHLLSFFTVASSSTSARDLLS